MEPLQTDEVIPVEQRVKSQDFDSVMLVGCSSFVFTSIGTYFVSVWPFWVWTFAERLDTLALDLSVGSIPALIFGIFACRRAHLAGACGFVGGMMTTAVFLFLRLEQVFLGGKVGAAPPPDYPEWARTAIPIGLVVFAGAAAILALPKQDLDLGNNSPSTD